MKLLVINNNAMFKKGEGVFIYKATGAFFVKLIKLGYEVESFQFLVEPKEGDLMGNSNIADKGVKITAVKKPKIKFLAYLKVFSKGIIRVIKNDFLFLFYPTSFYPLCFFAILIKKPFGFYIRGEKGITSKISKFLFKRAKFITTVSPKFTKLVNVYCADTETIAPMMDYNLSDIIYERNYLARSKFRLLFVGRVEADKGVFELIHSIKELVELGYMNIVLDIVGEGSHFLEAKEAVLALAMDNYITFHGSINDKEKLKSFYTSADIFILPTYHEGFPRVLYEAMIFGTPILTTLVGSIPQIMKDKYNCYRLEPQKVDSITTTIISFINNYQEMSVVAKNGTVTIIKYLQEYNLAHEDILNFKLKR